MKLTTGINLDSRSLGLGVTNQLSAMEVTVVLGAIENELDSLIGFASRERSGGTVERAVIRRFQSAEQIFEQIEQTYDRLRVKMEIVRERVIGGVGVHLLEDDGEPTETTP